MLSVWHFMGCNRKKCSKDVKPSGCSGNSYMHTHRSGSNERTICWWSISNKPGENCLNVSFVRCKRLLWPIAGALALLQFSGFGRLLIPEAAMTGLRHCACGCSCKAWCSRLFYAVGQTPFACGHF